MNNGRKIMVLLVIMILTFINMGVVRADTKNITVDNISIKEKSGTISVVDPVLSTDEITSNVTFNEKDDFVTFELKIKNNEEDKYKILSIEDNNTNKNISIEYSYDEDFILKGETTTITIKLKYNKQLLNVEKVNLNDLTIKINFENEEGNSNEVVINPVTSDNILHYLVLLIISITGLIIIVKKRKKIGGILLVLPILLIPFITFAKEKYELNIKFTDIVVKGEFETYNISIDKGNGTQVETKQITYGDKLGELPNASKDGYKFDKWVDKDGNEITEDTIITEPIEIIGIYKVITYNIEYDLDGGSATNPGTYTVESDDITLSNPTKTGYTFSGWTGSNGDILQTSVTITTGSTGNKNYKANFSANENTEYTVTHRYQNLDGTYTEEVVTEHGATDTLVAAPLKEKTGFVSPNTQNVTIAGDGSTSVTYVYDREEYAFSITDRTYIDSTTTANGTYQYGTEVTVKAIERDGYTFKWSDNDTNYERTFEINGVTTLTPIYTPNTNTPYTVKHYKMNLDGTNYTLADTKGLTGTTDSEITPALNEYEGFTPTTGVKTATINGDGSTVVEYYYTRNQVTVTINNPENIVEGDLSGSHYYGETITLTAKQIDNYTFTKWSNNETDNPLEITVGTNDITIGPVYTGNELTVSFNTDGGSSASSQTVNYGNKATRPTSNPTKTNYTFDNWYTDTNYNTLFDFENTIITSNTTIYAHFNELTFPVVFNEPGECTFNGSSGVITGEDCSFANGVNKYIDTGINLYNSTNQDKDYEIGFTIVSYVPSQQVSQATFMNTKLEGNKYPGLVFRRKTTTNDLDLSSRVTSSTNIQLFFDNTTTENVKIYRITNKETGIQEIFYSINDEEKVLVNDLSQFNPTFDLSVWFGASPADISATSAQRILKGTLKDMYIKLGTYQEDSNNYKITFNANGGSVTPASRKIDIGNEIGTLPIPTPPTGKEFIGWYTGLTDGEEVTSSYKPNSNKTIYARYTDISYIVSFNTNDGSTVASQTVNIGGKATRPTTNPTKNNYTFDNWYTDTSYNTLFDFENTIITKNTTIYAHFNDDQFPLVFNEPGECTFNGESGVITGEDCSFANGVNKYIDTGINLYNSTNKFKDYEIGFTIVNYNYVNQVSQATFMNSKQEASGYPGVVFRRKDIEAGYDLSSRNTSSQNARALFNYSDGIKKVKIYRITNGETGIQEIFYSINDSEKVLLNDLSQFNPTFDLSVWFGAAPTNSNATSAQRYLIGTMKDMYIKLGTYPEESDTDTYKITFNANGGSVTPSSKKINIGDEIGTLPTPTPPTGKTFDNWYTDLTGGIKVTSSYIQNNNITIYARYINDISGATISPSSISILNGGNETITVSNVEEEYTFSSNDTNIATVDETGKVTGTGVGTTTITITGTSSGKTKTINVTVESNTYTVTLNPNGGTVNSTSITQNKGTAIGELPTPTAPTGKEFDGWYTDLTGGIEVTSSYIPNNNITIYARYTDPCNGFSTDSWSTIRDNLENDSDYYAVGCEKEVELDMDNNGTNESYTVRLANTSTPEVCNTEGYSQTACGLVIEFVDLVASRQMNSTDTNEGGWKSTEMVSYLNNDLYNKLPSELQSVIIPTYPIVSGSGSGGVSDNIINNDTTKNKLYLLSGREVGSDLAFDNRKNTSTDTRILDYYEANNNDNARIKSGVHWWLRSAISNNFNNFYYVSRNGNYYITNISTTNGVAPAFRIGTVPSFTVSFDTDDGSDVVSQTITYGQKATRPATNPIKTGYTFDNWYTSDSYQTVFDFDNTTITSDTVIYARWELLPTATQYLANNATNTVGAGYSANTKGNMFQFSHKLNQGTENETTVTESRYIGDAPKNYVKFNCDDDGTNCETWRILGVFDVDDGTGNFEQRVKLLRGSPFATGMKWENNTDSTYRNDWTLSSLKNFLNGTYFDDTESKTKYSYDLKASARNMIGDAVYYLGAIDFSNKLTTEQLYAYERGTIVCGSCDNNMDKLTWTGEVALMYPSDEYMVYNGVDGLCYEAPASSSNCSSINAKKGWVYNSNMLLNTWLLSSHTGTSHLVFNAYDEGNLSLNSSNLEFGVRPVVYLKSSVKITGGTGEEGNPYTLQ